MSSPTAQEVIDACAKRFVTVSPTQAEDLIATNPDRTAEFIANDVGYRHDWGDPLLEGHDWRDDMDPEHPELYAAL